MAVLLELIDFFPYLCKPFDSLEIRKGMKITPIFCCPSDGDESHELIKTSALLECILFHLSLNNQKNLYLPFHWCAICVEQF